MNFENNSRNADKFVVRLPDGLRGQLEDAARQLDASMNTVFIQALRQYLDNQGRQKLLLDALAGAADTKVAALQQRLTLADQRVDDLESDMARIASGFKWESERAALLLNELQNIEQQTGSAQPSAYDGFDNGVD